MNNIRISAIVFDIIGLMRYAKMDLFIFIIIACCGLLGAVWYGRKTARFRWSEYAALIIFPTGSVLWLAYRYGTVVFSLYVASAVFGTLAEWVLGWTYHRTLGSRLWEYKRFSISGYTSILSMPFWGITGIIFILLAKILGI